jgi:hypothetical protein
MSNSDNNTSARTGAYAERLLAKIANKAGLSPDGTKYLKYVLDPFPDQERETASMPDDNQSKSNVSTVKQGITLVRPASLPSDQKWSAIIFFSGDMRAASSPLGVGAIRLTGGEINFEGSSDMGVYKIQPLTIYCAPSGDHLWPDKDVYPWLETHADRFSGLNFEPYLEDRCRLLGFGIEVHSTSPALYDGGSISVADVSSTVTKELRNIRVSDQSGSGPFVVPAQVALHNAPPGTLAEMTNLPGSRTWSAKEGVYAVGKQSKQENPYDPTQWSVPIWSNSYPSEPYIGGADEERHGVGAEPQVVAQTANISGINYAIVRWAYTPSQPVPFDMKVIMLTELDPLASFRVNFNAMIESIPDLDDQRLLVLAKPSAALDVNALELYSEVTRELPPGVPVSENASGKWWETVLGALEKYAGPVGNALGAVGVPGASLIGSGVSKAAGLGKALAMKQADKRSSNPPPQAKAKASSGKKK